MEQAARFARILTILRAHRTGVTRDEFLERLGISRAQFFKDIAVLRDQMGHPIVFDKKYGNKYRLDASFDPLSPRDEMPGIWLGAEECYALLLLHNVLREIDPGFLEEYLMPLRKLLKQSLGKHAFSSPGLSGKVGVEFAKLQHARPTVFSRLSEALARDRRLTLYFTSEDGSTLKREVSPQRIVLTETDWHLHALDHSDNRVRVIALPAIKKAEVVAKSAMRHPLFARYKTGAPETS